MIFRVTMKDPDVLQDAIEEEVNNQLMISGLSLEEQEAIRDIRCEKASEVAHNWFEYGEYLTVEIDTDKETIRVVSAEELGNG